MSNKLPNLITLVVAQLAEPSLLTLEDLCLNPVIGKMYLMS